MDNINLFNNFKSQIHEIFEIYKDVSDNSNHKRFAIFFKDRSFLWIKVKYNYEHIIDVNFVFTENNSIDSKKESTKLFAIYIENCSKDDKCEIIKELLNYFIK